MTTWRNAAICFSVTALLGSCTIHSQVTIRPDGSAFIRSSYSNKDKRDYYRSSIITDVDTAIMGPVFIISNVDSLGDYLPWFCDESLEFRRAWDRITIRSVKGAVGNGCLGVGGSIELLFVERGIRMVRYGGEPFPNDGKWVRFSRNRRQARKKGPLLLEIYLPQQRSTP